MRWMRFAMLPVLALSVAACQGGDAGSTGSTSPLVSEASLSEALARARETGRNVLVVYGRESCPWSRKMEEQTLSDSEVRNAIREFVFLRLEQGVNSSEFEASWGKQPTPTMVTLTADGVPVGKLVSGVVGKADFLAYAAWAKRGIGPQPSITKGGG